MIKKNSFFLVLIVSVLVFSLSGCIEKSVIGTYTHDNITIRFQDDGTYLYTKNGVTEKGTYTVNGNEIQTTNVLGMTQVAQITNAGLLDDENILWVKKV
jgi:uncharacterized lipoprotein YehR (DUF1307 family)